MSEPIIIIQPESVKLIKANRTCYICGRDALRRRDNFVGLGENQQFINSEIICILGCNVKDSICRMYTDGDEYQSEGLDVTHRVLRQAFLEHLNPDLDLN